MTDEIDLVVSFVCTLIIALIFYLSSKNTNKQNIQIFENCFLFNFVMNGGILEFENIEDIKIVENKFSWLIINERTQKRKKVLVSGFPTLNEVVTTFKIKP